MTLLDWSTTEQDTGRLWINGKVVFQKTVAVAMPNANTTNTAHGITGIDELVDQYGQAQRAAPFFSIPIARSAKSSAIALNIHCSVDATNIVLRSLNNYSVYVGNVTLLYTKT